MSYFVVFPIARHALGLEIKGFSKPSEALADAEEKASRFPLLIVAEDFGEGQRMGLLKIHVAKEEDVPEPDFWAEKILSSYGGCWKRALVDKAWREANSRAGERRRAFVGPQPQPRPFILYPIDLNGQVIEAEVKGCDSEQEADDVLADMQTRFASVVVVDLIGGEDGPYPLYIVGDVDPELAFELATFGRSLEKEFGEIEAALVD